MDGDTRRFPRAQAGPDTLIHFRLAGQDFSDLPLLTLGAGGCSLAAPEALATRAAHFQTLEDVRLECPGLPEEPFQAKVAWIAGRNPTCLGLTFGPLPEDLEAALSGHVMGLLGEPAPTQGY